MRDRRIGSGCGLASMVSIDERLHRTTDGVSNGTATKPFFGGVRPGEAPGPQLPPMSCVALLMELEQLGAQEGADVCVGIDDLIPEREVSTSLLCGGPAAAADGMTSPTARVAEPGMPYNATLSAPEIDDLFSSTTSLVAVEIPSSPGSVSHPMASALLASNMSVFGSTAFIATDGARVGGDVVCATANALDTSPHLEMAAIGDPSNPAGGGGTTIVSSTVPDNDDSYAGEAGDATNEDVARPLEAARLVERDAAALPPRNWSIDDLAAPWLPPPEIAPPASVMSLRSGIFVTLDARAECDHECRYVAVSACPHGWAAPPTPQTCARGGDDGGAGGECACAGFLGVLPAVGSLAGVVRASEDRGVAAATVSATVGDDAAELLGGLPLIHSPTVVLNASLPQLGEWSIQR